MIFIESILFEKRVKKLLTEDDLREFQNELIENPKKGDVIQGTGGLRKARIKSSKRQKGKRGGNRVICLYIEFLSHMHLLYIYGKDEESDLSTEERKELKEIAESIKTAAKKSKEQKKCQKKK